MSKLAILGGMVIDPLNKIDKTANLYIADGKIVAITDDELADFQADKVVNAKGLTVAPGFVDLNATVLAPQANSQAFAANLEKATSVGITHLGTYAFTATQALNAAEIAHFQSLAMKTNRSKVYFIAALTQRLEGQRLNELKLLQEVGCIGVSNGRQPIRSNLVKRRCYDYAAMLGLKVYIGLEDPDFSEFGCMHEGEVSMRLGLPGIPSLSEYLAATRELLLLAETGINAHLCRVSAGDTVGLLERLGSKSSNVTCDVAIHQLFLTENAVTLENGFCHVNPPFRTQADLEQLQEAVARGQIDAITSDHIALPKQVKEVPFQDSEPGIATWPLLLPLLMKLVADKKISLSQAISHITSIPAKILGIDAAHLSKNAPANVTIFDAKESWYLSESDLALYGANNPFRDWQLQGRVALTIIDGEVVYSRDEA